MPTPLIAFPTIDQVDRVLLRKLETTPHPSNPYVIAMTPRSGSSYLCDLLARSKVFGCPGEQLNTDFIPSVLQAIPATNADTYLRNNLRHSQTPNGVSGIKASWFQLSDFLPLLAQPDVLTSFKYISLLRKDTVLQAISLYRATATGVFHTNIEHSGEALRSLGELPFDYAKIDYWHRHIVLQQQGWEAFFRERGITPLGRIAEHLGVPTDGVAMPEAPSIFKKLGGDQNVVWRERFVQEAAAAKAAKP